MNNSILWANTDSGSSNHGPQITGMSCLSVHNTIQNFSCPGPCNGCSGMEILTHNPQFIDIDGADNNAATVLDNNYRLRVQSPSADSGENDEIPGDDLDVNDGADSPAEPLPWDLDREDRVFGGISTGTVDRGAFEMPCEVTYYPADCVTTATFAPPPDGVVDSADLAYLLGAWCTSANCCVGCCSDMVTSATFAPPPDGKVDSADLAFLLGQPDDGPIDCDDVESEGFGGSTFGDQFAETYLGLLLEELVATGDEDLIPDILAILAEWNN